MNKTPELYIEGPAFWSPTLPGWDAASAVFRGEAAPTDPPAKRPSPQVLAPAERRRAPDTVALSLEVTPWSRWDGVSVDFAARDAARQVIDAYLSREHFDDVEGTPDGYFAQRCGAERQRRPAQL